MENGENRLRKAQEDVDEVKVIMLDNLNKADERSTKLGELEDRADELRQKILQDMPDSWSVSASLNKDLGNLTKHYNLGKQDMSPVLKPIPKPPTVHPFIKMYSLEKSSGEAFSKTSAKVKQKKRWENNKYKVIIGAVITVVVILIIVIIIIKYIPPSGADPTSGVSEPSNKIAGTLQPKTTNASG